MEGSHKCAREGRTQARGVPWRSAFLTVLWSSSECVTPAPVSPSEIHSSSGLRRLSSLRCSPADAINPKADTKHHNHPRIETGNVKIRTPVHGEDASGTRGAALLEQGSAGPFVPDAVAGSSSFSCMNGDDAVRSNTLTYRTCPRCPRFSERHGAARVETSAGHPDGGTKPRGKWDRPVQRGAGSPGASPLGSWAGGSWRGHRRQCGPHRPASGGVLRDRGAQGGRGHGEEDPGAAKLGADRCYTR